MQTTKTQRKKTSRAKTSSSLGDDYRKLAGFMITFILLMAAALVLAGVIFSYACSHGTDCARTITIPEMMHA